MIRQSFEPSREVTEAFQREGYVLVPGLFTPQEVKQYVDHYMTLPQRAPSRAMTPRLIPADPIP